jgi:predicted AlkP superfamily phosphohydrolase/phosphomutase
MMRNANPRLVATLLFCLVLAGCQLPRPIPAAPSGDPQSLYQATFTPIAVENSPGNPHQPTPSPTFAPLPEGMPTSPPAPTVQPETRRHPVIVIGWDGAQAGAIYDLMASGSLPHFAALAGQGVRAAAQSVDPPLTAPAFSSMATGSYPALTGMVSNDFHDPNDSFYWYRSAFDEPFDQAEPVWVTASRNGLTTATVFFSGASPAFPDQMADYSVGYGVREAYSSQQTVPLAPAKAWENAPVSYSPALEGAFQIPEIAHVRLLVVDTTDDHTANYDAVLLTASLDGGENSRKVTNRTPKITAGGWGSLILRTSPFSGADILIQKIDSGQVTLFHSAVERNTAAPSSLIKALNQKFSFPPAEPDTYALQHGWITPLDYLHMLGRFSDWLAKVTAWVSETYHPDLLFTWQVGFDAAGHAFMLQDPRQAGYSPERANDYAGYLLQAAQVSDLALGTMLRQVDLKDTTVLMVADHGMAPCHTTVYVNTLLQQAGLLTLDKRDYVVVNRSRAFAVASGGATHIYINLKGREQDGIVSVGEYLAVQKRIIDLFKSVVDPVTGKPVFQRVLARSDLGPLGLDHINSGDVFVQAAPGYTLDGWRGKRSAFAPSPDLGQHGYDSSLPEMQGLFIAAGYGIPSTGEEIPPLRIVDIAPTIASLLDFMPAPTVGGTLILELRNR